MRKTWDQMTVDEKFDHLRFMLEDFINHYNNETARRNDLLNSIGDRLKRIEDSIRQK